MSNLRIGSGLDIHALVKGRRLILGGVQIECDKGCLGHSDGDALIHAVIDAMLGASSLGDIGTLFPDTDDSYKDIDSQILLKRTCSLLDKCNWHVVNADVTVVLQRPHLASYKNSIRDNLAGLLDVDSSCVSIKAKTAEHMLGELGTGDAVMCQACVLIEKKQDCGEN